MPVREHQVVSPAGRGWCVCVRVRVCTRDVELEFQSRAEAAAAVDVNQRASRLHQRMPYLDFLVSVANREPAARGGGAQTTHRQTGGSRQASRVISTQQRVSKCIRLSREATLHVCLTVKPREAEQCKK